MGLTSAKEPIATSGANGGFELPRDYSEAMVENATEVSDAIADTLLGYYAYWPHCPEDDHLLTVHVDEHEQPVTGRGHHRPGTGLPAGDRRPRAGRSSCP